VQGQKCHTENLPLVIACHGLDIFTESGNLTSDLGRTYHFR